MEKLLAKYFSGEATSEEEISVKKWRSESHENSEAFFKAKVIWSSSEQVSAAPPSHILDNILGRSEETNTTGKKEAKVVEISRPKWFRYIAAAIVIVGFGFILSTYMGGTSGQIVRTLADGSVISLDRGADLKKVFITDELREVTIIGRGYFDIQRDEKRPFIVNTQDARVEVLGTSFLVDTRGEKTEVRVESGLVALVKPGETKENDLVVKLEKGEFGSVSKKVKGITKRVNDNPNYLSWKTKVLVFNQAKLSEVKTTFEDVYGVKLILENPALQNCKLTAKFNKKKAKDAVEIIARTFNLTYQFTGRKAILKGKGC